MILNPANARFGQTLETSASPEMIWTIWTNVQAWPTWDTELEYAKLEGPFVLGAKGKLKAKGNQEAEFVITALEPGRSYTFSTILPMNSSLNVQRSLEQTGTQTSFTHLVTFEGPLAAPISNQLGPVYRAALPMVMERIRVLAEATK